MIVGSSESLTPRTSAPSLCYVVRTALLTCRKHHVRRLMKRRALVAAGGRSSLAAGHAESTAEGRRKLVQCAGLMDEPQTSRRKHVMRARLDMPLELES